MTLNKLFLNTSKWKHQVLNFEIISLLSSPNCEVKSSNLPLFNQCLEILNTLLKAKDGCKILVETQKLVTQNPNPKTLALTFQSDYLCPFFDLHPADFRNGFRFVSPDISSSASINMMRSQYISLMDSMNVTNVSDCINLQPRIYRHRF